MARTYLENDCSCYQSLILKVLMFSDLWNILSSFIRLFCFLHANTFKGLHSDPKSTKTCSSSLESVSLDFGTVIIQIGKYIYLELSDQDSCIELLQKKL